MEKLNNLEEKIVSQYISEMVDHFNDYQSKLKDPRITGLILSVILKTLRPIQTDGWHLRVSPTKEFMAEIKPLVQEIAIKQFMDKLERIETLSAKTKT